MSGGPDHLRLVRRHALHADVGEVVARGPQRDGLRDGRRSRLEAGACPGPVFGST
jgi:hypothetical protein